MTLAGHGQPGLRSGLRAFDELTEWTQSTKDVFVELRPIQEIKPSTWAVDQGGTYVTAFDFIFDGIRRDVVTVRSLLDTGLVRVETLADCRNIAGTFFYDADEEFAQIALSWDVVGQTWDAAPTMFWDQFPRLFVHLTDGSNPGLSTVVAGIGFYFSSAGKTRLDDANVHPALSQDLLLLGDLETWVDGVPQGWTLSGTGGIPIWDDAVTTWDQAAKFWDPLTINIMKDTSIFKSGGASIRFDITADIADRSIFRTIPSTLIVGKYYRLHGWYRSSGAAVPTFAVRTVGSGATIYLNGRDASTADENRNLDPTGEEWRRFTFDFRAISSTMFVVLRGGSNVVGSVWFDNIKVSRVWRYNWYEPRLMTSSLPSINTGSNDIFFGGKTIGVGSITFVNQDGMLERLAAEVEWANQAALVDIGGQFSDDKQEVLADDWFRGFTGLIQSITATDQNFKVDLQDQRVFFHIKLPPRLYDDQVFTLMDTRKQGQPRPIFFGAKENISPVRISRSASTGYGTYEICDTLESPNGIKAVDMVYAYINQAEADLESTTGRLELGTPTDYTNDFAAGTFTIVRDIGPYVIDEGNRRLDFNIGGSEFVAVLSIGLFTATALALEVQTQMRAAASVSTIDVAYSDTTHKFTISRPSGTLNLKTNTGANKDKAPYKLLGYTLGADKTGSLSYTGENVTFTSADKNHLVRVDAQGFKDDALGTYTGSPLSLIEIGVDICRVILIKYMKKSPAIADETSFLFARQRAPESLTMFLNKTVSTKDIFDRLEFSNIANIVVNGEGKVFYKVYVGDIPARIADLDDRHFTTFTSGQSNREVFTTIRIKHDQDPTTGLFDAREATDSSVIVRLGRPDIREFETYIKKGDNAISAANRFLELSRTAARKISGMTLGSIMLRLEVGDKFRLSKRRAISKGGIITSEIFRVISLNKNPLAGKVSFEATDDRVTVASEACVSNCQQFCESTCQIGCQQICQGTCESSCQGSCEGSCQVSCEASCQSTCELGCQTTCQKACQDTCQQSCQAACQGAGCQTVCESACQTTCETTCQTACQASCQGNCQVTCQSGCQVTCQTGCQVSCQTACQTGCQTTCELNCQDACQTGCQSSCQQNCQTVKEGFI
jgi:hypothetical protein